jgi:hypothetical protein
MTGGKVQRGRALLGGGIAVGSLSEQCLHCRFCRQWVLVLHRKLQGCLAGPISLQICAAVQAELNQHRRDCWVHGAPRHKVQGRVALEEFQVAHQ